MKPDPSLVRKRGAQKRLFIAACALAIVLGAFAGYLGYSDEAEAQFHGGVLEEDRMEAMWALVTAAAEAFARTALVSVLVLGVVPICVWRCFRKRR